MKIPISILMMLLVLACNQKEEKTKSKSQTNHKEITSKTLHGNPIELNKTPTITPNKILGIWTDGSTENATFEIKLKSIYYVDDFKQYNYILNKDSILITYPDYRYSAKISLKNDTLVMVSKENKQAKFWHFKE